MGALERTLKDEEMDLQKVLVSLLDRENVVGARRESLLGGMRGTQLHLYNCVFLS